MEQNRPSYNLEDNSNFKKLIDWGIANGVDVSKIKPSFYWEDNRGFHAATNIHKGDVVFNIPYNLLITLDLVYSSSINKQIQSRRIHKMLKFPTQT